MRNALLAVAVLATAACARPEVRTAAAPAPATGLYVVDGTLVAAPSRAATTSSAPLYIIDGVPVVPASP